eukprot:TRINITY_DN8144_c0_g1_i1.p1 TRINITY_DN8144_c0_g1~~TRINITY_DN8144_c0_g1_i1.p1  ORF type:complete len:210 (+),score=38.52 TRINITY_DN8144_c0_g1_i1:45-674(+)
MGKGCCAGKKNRDASDPNHTLGISGGPNRPLDLTKGVKVCLLGEAGVGKSSILNRYIRDEFHEGEAPTIGAAFATKNHIRGSQTTKFEIWDTAGQERYHSLAPMYYRGSFAALIVFDITQYYTFEKAKAWITELRTNCPTIIALYIVGCKLDLEKNRAVETNEAQHFATDNNCQWLELSYNYSIVYSWMQVGFRKESSGGNERGTTFRH